MSVDHHGCRYKGKGERDQGNFSFNAFDFHLATLSEMGTLLIQSVQEIRRLLIREQSSCLEGCTEHLYRKKRSRNREGLRSYRSK